MPNAVWPPSLPQFVEIDGYDETLPFPVLRTAMQTGPAKQRRTSTAAETPIAFVTDVMTAEQAATFEAFYLVTLLTGALPFDWVHPRTQQTMTYRFTAGPKPVPAKGGRVRYRLQLEVLP